MTLFWFICAALSIVAILFVAIPLWRGISKSNSVERDAANLEILRDQITEMDNDLKNGLLTPELHEQGKRELQARLLDEVGDSKGEEVSNKPHPLKITAVVLAVLLPLASVGLYLKIGNPNALLPQPAFSGGGIVRDEASLKALEEKSAQNPNDPEVLFILARSYVELGRYADGARKYDSLTRLVPNEAALWADYADALAMTHSTLVGAPTKLLDRALEIDPNLAKALALSGTAAMERGDYAAALVYWGKLLKQIQPGSEDAKMIEEGLQQARQMLAQSKGGKVAPALEQINEPPATAQAAAGKERITGTVNLSDALKSQADPEDTVFVLARAAEGPKMPLAILRKQVKDLPVKFSLDDSMAMSPAMKMSNFDQVVVVARVSKSGNAMPQAGDLMGMSKPLALGSSGVKISIDQQVR
ncbi:formate-dependent nitrite reductase complex subunit NrfG [mine drainage metagenome]|uniref:Formate-dependent nitrite reductase complex subunit NrfG n=1 Tax=mine drainage metagenome TaxID=410659 RepID=A0A1J5SLX1_9ZZZZ